MARQKGIIKLEGKIGDLSFYKTQDGHLARTKGGVDKSRIANDPAFARTRENGAEFGRAGKGGKLIQKALRTLLQNSADNRVTSRLTKEVVKVVKADTTNARGERTVIAGDVIKLKGFEFNKGGILSSILFSPFTASVDRPAGVLEIVIPEFTPMIAVEAPPGTTHIKIVSGGSEIKFDEDDFLTDDAESAMLEWNSDPVGPITLTTNVTPASTHPLFLVLGIEFYQEVNGEFYSLKDGKFNGLSIVELDVV